MIIQMKWAFCLLQTNWRNLLIYRNICWNRKWNGLMNNFVQQLFLRPIFQHEDDEYE